MDDVETSRIRLPAFLLILAFLSLALSVKAAPPAPTPTTAQVYEQERKALATSFSALMATGATPAQLQAWQTENAPRLTAQQQRAIAMAQASIRQPMPINPAPRIPTNVSPALRDFLTTQNDLANARAQIHNDLIKALPANPTPAQLQQLQQTETTTFEQQQGPTLKLQTQRALALAAESASQPLPLPPPLVIPTGASPQLTAYLTAQDQLMRERAQLWNKNLAATPAARNALLDQWQQQNAARFQHLHQLATQLSPPPVQPLPQ